MQLPVFMRMKVARAQNLWFEIYSVWTHPRYPRCNALRYSPCINEWRVLERDTPGLPRMVWTELGQTILGNPGVSRSNTLHSLMHGEYRNALHLGYRPFTYKLEICD